MEAKLKKAGEPRGLLRTRSLITLGKVILNLNAATAAHGMSGETALLMVAAATLVAGETTSPECGIRM